jgi:glucan phosphorylase
MDANMNGMKNLSVYKGWSLEVPEQEGWYWFWGDAFRTKNSLFPSKTELYMVHVHKISNGFAYVANGNFMENKDGLWQDAVVPDVPEEK